MTKQQQSNPSQNKANQKAKAPDNTRNAAGSQAPASELSKRLLTDGATDFIRVAASVGSCCFEAARAVKDGWESVTAEGGGGGADAH